MKTPKSAFIAAASRLALPAWALLPALALETGPVNPADATLRRIDALGNNQQRSSENLSAADLAIAQETISADASLMSALNAQGVRLKNICG